MLKNRTWMWLVGVLCALWRKRISRQSPFSFSVGCLALSLLDGACWFNHLMLRGVGGLEELYKRVKVFGTWKMILLPIWRGTRKEMNYCFSLIFWDSCTVGVKVSSVVQDWLFGLLIGLFRRAEGWWFCSHPFFDIGDIPLASLSDCSLKKRPLFLTCSFHKCIHLKEN